jgi:putative CocE/NonD family hydrolase
MDGATLRADVYRPATADAVPVLLHRTPYGRHQANYREMAEAIAAHGYVVVVQDLRGRFDSEGEFLPMWVSGRLDGSDGARAVEWAQTLPGAQPTVGMYGVSYDASVQWETAALRPAGLRSIFPGGMVADSRSVWPGVFRVGRQLKWYLMLAADTRRRLGLPPPHTRADSDLLWHLEAGK